MQTKRKPSDEDEGQGGAGSAVRPSADDQRARVELESLTLSENELLALRDIARVGGGKGYVTPKNSTPSVLRQLRTGGFLDLMPGTNGRDLAQLTARGLKALAAAPGFAR